MFVAVVMLTGHGIANAVAREHQHGRRLETDVSRNEGQISTATVLTWFTGSANHRCFPLQSTPQLVP